MTNLQDNSDKSNINWNKCIRTATCADLEGSELSSTSTSRFDELLLTWWLDWLEQCGKGVDAIAEMPDMSTFEKFPTSEELEPIVVECRKESAENGEFRRSVKTAWSTVDSSGRGRICRDFWLCSWASSFLSYTKFVQNAYIYKLWNCSFFFLHLILELQFVHWNTWNLVNFNNFNQFKFLQNK